MSTPISKCIDKYQEFLNTISENVEDDFVRLGNLISCDKLSEFEEPIEFVYALHNIQDKCYRITNKKSQYYTHRYDPSFIYELVKDLDFKDEILRAFDLEPKDNCCNCVSFVCYSGGKLNLLFDYLYSQKKSLDNISNNLEGFISKFYFDSSIFETIYRFYSTGNEFEKYISIECFKILKYILAHPKSETFIYFCKMIIEGLPLSKVRTLRFLPMFEPDVNIRVIREADGFVSYLDCHNIKQFVQVNKIGMFYEFAESFDMFKYFNYRHDIKNSVRHYSAWLRTYSKLKYMYMTSPEVVSRFREYINDNYNKNFIRPPDSNIFEDATYNYMDYYKLFEVLAGTLALKVKFSFEYLNEKANFISEVYTHSEKYKDQLDSHETTHTKVLHTGYDEILLLELFEPIITLNKKTTSLPVKLQDKIKELIEKSGVDGIIALIKEHAINVKDNILNMFVLISNNDKTIYQEEIVYIDYRTEVIINTDYAQVINGEKISLLNEKSTYTIDVITNPEYKTKVQQLIKQINDSNFGGQTYGSYDREYSFMIDYLIDLAYKPTNLLPEFNDYFYNIGINLLNKKFYNLYEKIFYNQRTEPESIKKNNAYINKYLKVDITLLNVIYTDIYPQSNPEPTINYKSKYLKYKEKYLQLKKLIKYEINK